MQKVSVPTYDQAYLATVMMDPESCLLDCTDPLVCAVAADTSDPDTLWYLYAICTKLFLNKQSLTKLNIFEH